MTQVASSVPHMLATYGVNAISARLLMYSWVHISVPFPLVPMVIGESCILPVDKYTIYACCSGPCSCAKLIYGHYLLSCSCSSRPHTSSHPYGPYGPCSYFTRVPYHVAPCRPLRPGPGLPSTDQRGVAQEKLSCGGPRPCLAYGLLLLVLPVGQSGCHPSSHDDIIQGSTWNYPDKDHFSYVGICQHANGWSSDDIHHRNVLF